MGQAYYGLSQHTQAADAYNTYMTRIPGVLDGYVQEYRGDALDRGARIITGAQNAYNAALTAPRLDDGLDLQIKIAQARAAFGDYAGALTLYDQIFPLQRMITSKRKWIIWPGTPISNSVRTIRPTNAYQHAVENYPLSYYSYLVPGGARGCRCRSG